MKSHLCTSALELEFETEQILQKSLFPIPMDPKFSRVVTSDEGTPPKKARADIVVTWQTKAIYLHFQKVYGLQI